MPKWEYMGVTFHMEGGISRPRRINQNELPNWKRGPSIWDYLNQMGREGWEVVTMPDYTVSPFTVLLKRPIS